MASNKMVELANVRKHKKKRKEIEPFLTDEKQ